MGYCYCDKYKIHDGLNVQIALKSIILATNSMSSPPESIKLYFYKTLEGDISIENFEKWLYENKDLEKTLNPDDYLDLISFNYKQGGAKYNLCKLLERYVDLGNYETYKLLKLLNRAKEKNKDLAEILVQFYDLYCRGYGFLRYIGIHYGLAIEIEGRDFWSAEMREEHEMIIKSFSPELDNQLQQIIDWLISGKIILTGTKDELNRFEYQDFRTEKEKKLTEWEYNSNQKKKKWWHIW
jgi:hypothetical protein